MENYMKTVPRINVNLKVNTGEKGQDKRKTNIETLLKQCPKLKEIQTDNLLDVITKELFPNGLEKEVFIRNLSRSESGSSITFGLRPVPTEGDFCQQYLDENETFLLTGHRMQKGNEDVGVCMIDSIQIIQKTEKQDYEKQVLLDIDPKPLPGDLDFISTLAELPPVRQNTTKQLNEWQDYLKWRREITNKQIHGAKYFNFKFDREKNCISFGLIFNSKELYEQEERYLKRDICIFNNIISLDSWNFKYDKELRYSDRIEIGAWKSFSKGVPLQGNAEENPQEIHKHPNSGVENKNIEKTSDKAFSEEDLQEIFKDAYIVYVSYKLPEDLLENLEDKEENFEEIEEYLSKIPKNGFIARSAAGEFALIRRFENAIKDLINGEKCYSQTLINWLFDVKKAKVPLKKAASIEKWDNPDIEENENQRLAVEKALNAEEVFLLQGPPGTGKTTVIAEIIFQSVKQGLRVLISSQSNDAVDNALDKLSIDPAIRAIRLGARGGKKKKKDNEKKCKYIERDTLKYYYESLSRSITSTFLEDWNRIDENLKQTQKDLRDISLLQNDLDELRRQHTEHQSALDSYGNDYKEIVNKLKEIEKSESEKENLRRKFDTFIDFIDKGTPYNILPNEFDSILNNTLTDVKSLAENMGIKIPDNFISAHTFVHREIKDLIENLHKTTSSNSSNSELENLNARIKLCKEEMMEAYESDNEDKGRAKKKELDKLKLEHDKLKESGGLELSSDLHNAFSDDLQNQCKNDKDAVIPLLKSIFDQWNKDVDAAQDKMRNLFRSESAEERTSLTEEKKILEGKIETLKQELSDKKKKLDSKQEEINKLRSRYNATKDTTDIDLKEMINSRLSELQNAQNKSQSLRSVFGDTMQKFCQKIEDETTYQYDKEYFLNDYINSCNVVGISCTNNMRNLSDKGFDNFDVVIIDEVSKATPPELLIPLMKAGKVILVGDHRQLPPMFEEHEKSYKEMIDDLSEDETDLKEVLTEENFKKYKNMVTASLFKSYFEEADDKIKHSLLTQYRMHSEIMNVINRFYEGRLVNGLSPSHENWEKGHNLTIEGIDGSSFVEIKHHVYWLDSSLLPHGEPIYETFRENSTSACNILEKYLIIELLKKIAKKYKEQGHTKDNPVSLGIISFYQRQVNEIRAEVEKVRTSQEFKGDFESLDIDVNTVDRFQGQEKNIIITSLVRNNKQGHTSKHVVTYERINVAFSRAQNLLFIVGAAQTYEKQKITIPKMESEGKLTLPVYKDIIDELQRCNCFVKSAKLISADLEKTILKEYNSMGGK